MAIKLTTTKMSAKYIKALCYGFAGVGKTTLCKTAPEPIIISAEAGLLSLADVSIPVIEIKNADDLKEAFLFVTTSSDAKKFQTICLDSITDIGEVLLSDLKEKNKDPRKAYGDLADQMGKLVRAFRDISDRHIYFTAKANRIVDESGITSHIPHMPGKQLVTNLPYWFDLVLPLRIGKTDEGETYRYLQSQPSMYWEAKDRSGKLNPMEEPNLEKLFAKIINGDGKPAPLKKKPAPKKKAAPKKEKEEQTENK